MKSTTIKLILLSVLLLGLFFRICFGIFVIQPMGFIPKGTTIIYWRLGTKFEFIESADGIIIRNNISLSLLTRAVALGSISDPILKREVARLPYSETLYLASTNGIKFEK